MQEIGEIYIHLPKDEDLVGRLKEKLEEARAAMEKVEPQDKPQTHYEMKILEKLLEDGSVRIEDIFSSSLKEDHGWFNIRAFLSASFEILMFCSGGRRLDQDGPTY